MKNDDYKPHYIDMIDLPPRSRVCQSIWLERFKAIPKGKAAELHYNNRQRAHQVAGCIRQSASHQHIKIGTRIIHAQKEIQGKDGWIVYYWIKEDKDGKQNR